MRDHEVVLVSGKGPVRVLTDAITRAPIRGSWRGHPDGKTMF
jgi:hypothetical protein